MTEDEVRNALVQWLYDEGRTELTDGMVELTILEDSSAEIVLHQEQQLH